MDAFVGAAAAHIVPRCRYTCDINSGLVVGLAGTFSGVLMAALAFAISRAPGWRELRSFAFVAITAAAYCFFDLVNVMSVSERTLRIGEGLALGSCFLHGLMWIRHLAAHDERPRRQWQLRLEQSALAVAIGIVVLALVPGVLIELPIRSVRVEWFGATYTMATATPLGVACVAVMLLAVLAAAFGGGRRWRDGWHARLPMLGATTLALTGVSDTLAFMQIIPMPQLIEAVTVVVVGALGASYAGRFIADAHRLDKLSTKLEQEVAIRTVELAKSQTREAQHERLAGLGRMAAGVAHEINNPTMVIQQNLDRIRTVLAEAGTLTPEVDARLGRSRAATQHIADIVRQLLETGRRPAADNSNTTAFALSVVVAKAVAAVAVRAPALAITVSVDESLCARGDPRLFEQVLVNLLVNAAHATSGIPGGGRATIVGERQGDRVSVRVTDNGHGIAESMRMRLFEPFATTKPVGQGTGLGLAVSRSLMTQQAGALFLADSTPAGTEMALELPVADASDARPGEPPALPEATPTIRSNLRVLFIDDNEDLRELLVLQLDRYFQIDAAPTVDEALAMVANGPEYDVVLCDLMMPRGGAESWLARCSAIDPRLEDRTILLTAGPTTDAANQLVEQRREKVIFKPVVLDDLRPMIERVARGSTVS